MRNAAAARRRIHRLSRQLTPTRRCCNSIVRSANASTAAAIDLYYAPTPNGWKISIALYEMAMPFNYIPVDLLAGDQFTPEFLAISPNNRMPAIVDRDGPDGGPMSVFESGAILLYLARKHGTEFCPSEREDPRGYSAVTEWLFWQVGGLGPMAGQLSHFRNYAPHVDTDANHDYAEQRYAGEYERLLSVMDRRLAKSTYLALDTYSIADMVRVLQCWFGEECAAVALAAPAAPAAPAATCSSYCSYCSYCSSCSSCSSFYSPTVPATHASWTLTASPPPSLSYDSKACFGWVLAAKNFGLNLAEWHHLKRWYDALKVRPALRKGVNLGKGTTAFSNTVGAADTDAVKRLFVQGKETGRRS